MPSYKEKCLITSILIILLSASYDAHVRNKDIDIEVHKGESQIVQTAKKEKQKEEASSKKHQSTEIIQK